MRTRSFRIQADSATVTSGAANVIVVTATIGRRASAAKLKNMPATLIMPRARWPKGREGRNAAASSPRPAENRAPGNRGKDEGQNTPSPGGRQAPAEAKNAAITENISADVSLSR